MNDWRDKHVIITGASSGIGRATAELLAQRGARLGLIARRADVLQSLCANLSSQGATAAFAVADVTDAAGVEAATKTLEAALGPCNVLIASAGVHRYTHGAQFPGADARLVLNANILGVVNSIDAVLPGMLRRRDGHIAAIASIAAMLGLPGVGAYSASKAAVVTLLESLRVDLHPHGVRVTTVCPGFVDTPMLGDHDRRVLRFLLTPQEAARRIVQAIEQNRAEAWFPWQTWLMARTARWLPFSLYRRLVSNAPPPPESERFDAEHTAPT